MKSSVLTAYAKTGDAVLCPFSLPYQSLQGSHRIRLDLRNQVRWLKVHDVTANQPLNIQSCQCVREVVDKALALCVAEQI
jgi:hypothetical protein